MVAWSFLTNHARTLLFISAHPDTRLRDLATALGVTERTTYGIVADLTSAGYLVKERAGRRNRYEIQAHLPLPDANGALFSETNLRVRTVGELLALLVEPEPPTSR